MTGAYVTTGKAANAIGVDPATLARWARAGIVTPALRTPGGHLRWDLTELRAQLRAMPATASQPGTPEPAPVVAAIVTSPLGVLITRRHDGRPPWGFVSGEIEPGESPADAAVREVKEETGLQVRPGRVIGRRVHPATGRTMVYMSADPQHGTDVFIGDPAELAEVRWAPLTTVLELLPGIYEPVREYLGRALRAAS